MNPAAPALSADRDWLADLWRTWGARPALLAGDQVLSYADLERESRATATAWRAAGGAPGTVAALTGPDPARWLAGFFGLWQAGAVVVPIAPEAEPEREARLRAGRVESLCLTDPGWSVRPLEASAGEAPPPYRRLRESGRAGLVLFSSGSTGTPKALVHDLDTLLGKFRGRREKLLTIVPLLLFDHIGGLNTIWHALTQGATLAVPPGRTPAEVCATIARHRAQLLPATPSFLRLLEADGAWRAHDLSSLRLVTYGTEPMPPGLLERLKAMLPQVRFRQTFGTSETGIHPVTGQGGILRFEEVETRVEDGELWLRGATQALGYLDPAHNQAFTPDGWFRTGDLVEPLGDDQFRLLGRRSDWINVAGRKVLPAEVESILLEDPGLLDATVRGEPHPLTGQVVVADLVARPGHDPEALRSALRQRCRERLEAHKVPVKFRFQETLATSARLKKIR